MERRELVADITIRDILVRQLKVILDAAGNAQGLILDGFPRTLGQASMLEGILQELQLRFTGCLSLKVDEEVLIQRLIKRAEIEKRPDDTEDVIRERMRVYKEKTQPLENYFGEQKQLIEVDGLGTVDDVFGRLEPIIRSW